MSHTTTPDLPFGEIAEDDPNLPWLILTLGHGQWMTAEQLLHAAAKPATEANRRWLRALANASNGEVFSGPGSPGYKLTREMTHEEYHHHRNAMRHQAAEMIRRILRSDRVFYANPKPTIP
jgi:hypothetical protein